MLSLTIEKRDMKLRADAVRKTGKIPAIFYGPKEASTSISIPLVLHGGSGQGDDLVRKAIKAGVAIVHVNTELRLAYRSGLMKSLSDNPDEVAPYKYMKPAKLAMQRVVEEKLKVVNNL